MSLFSSEPMSFSLSVYVPVSSLPVFETTNIFVSLLLFLSVRVSGPGSYFVYMPVVFSVFACIYILVCLNQYLCLFRFLCIIPCPYLRPNLWAEADSSVSKTFSVPLTMFVFVSVFMPASASSSASISVSFCVYV